MTIWFRFRELEERNIVRSWTQLRNLIGNYGFPPGRMTGGNRTWTDQEIADWRERCPVEGPELRGAAKMRAAARKQTESTAATTITEQHEQRPVTRPKLCGANTSNNDERSSPKGNAPAD